MENIFIHDAIPTWSGFIYQGEIAVYLAVKKICELRDQENLTLDEIGSKYFIEVENCEDISLVKVDSNSKCYLSIHQVKNQKDSKIGAYHSPLVQLMLEKGFHNKEKLGDPKAFLHVSNAIQENYDGEVINNLDKWFKEIQEFYIKLKDLTARVGINDEKVIVAEILKIVNEEPIKLNRSEYNKGLIKK